MTDPEKKTKTEVEWRQQGVGAAGNGGEQSKATDSARQSRPRCVEEEKVVIHLKNVGSAPLLKNPKILINANDRFARVINFLKPRLGTGNVFLYINSTFAPSPFALVKELYHVFSLPVSLISVSASRTNQSQIMQ